MSELTNTKGDRNDLRWKLLASVSVLALIGNLAAARDAKADDAGKPDIWIELGGQLEQFASTEDSFAPPFLTKTPRPAFEAVYPVDAEKPPHFAMGGGAKATFEPAGTNWVFSASVRYGRSNGDKVVHQQSELPSVVVGTHHAVLYFDNYATTKVTHDESHAIADFQAGKDVGLGMFGRDSTSTFSLGVRYAQFASKTTVNIRERPDLHFNDILPYPLNKVIKYFHSYALTAHSARSFQAVGPLLSWDASVPFAGKPEATEFTFDWGVNGAILFGRQKASVNHHTSGRYVEVRAAMTQPLPYEHSPVPRDSRHSITVPNLGGFAGVSLKWPIAKVSLGYRADFFFGAVDGGIDTRVSKTLGFNGPYASISVGL